MVLLSSTQAIKFLCKEYLDNMEAHTARTKHSLSLDKMLGDKKVELNGREQDLRLCEAALVEAQCHT
jgi:hypothetical protein